jgi:hypothetical protein
MGEDMFENFDDFEKIFNDFFKKFKTNYDYKEINNFLNEINNSVDMQKFFENYLNNDLGEPDQIEDLNENGFIFKKYVWNTPSGKIIKIVLDENQDILEKKENKEKTLEELLQEAVDVEDYETAIKIRDLINQKK